MYRKVLLLAAFLLCAAAAPAQVDEAFKRDVIESGYVHKPLRLHEDKAVETAGLQKEVLHSELLCDMESLDGWTHDGIGTISLTTDRAVEGTHSLRLEAPSMPEKMLGWGLGRGTCLATYDLHGVDWRPYNRLRFSIYPECEGARTVYLNLYLENDGEVKVPDRFGREGYHEINLKNNQWNDCYLEFPALERDKVTCLKFAIEIFGRELTMGDTLRFDVDNVLLETIAEPEPVKGWQPADGRIIFSTTGYTTRMEKTAVVTIPDAKKFKIINDKTGRTALRGKVKTVQTPLGEFRTIDFSKLRKPGRYVIKVGDVKTWPFYIDDNVWDDSAWRLVNFMFVERCGYPVPGHHGACHSDLHATYKGKVYPLHGGWHDAGDMSQQTVQSAEISYAFFQAAQRALAKGNTDLYNRLMEEGLWGMDYVLRSRLGDGYRAMSWGTNLWTDGALDTEDDAGRRQIRVHDGALENFLFAGIEAYTSMILPDDPEMAGNLVKAAREDYGYAQARFDSLGFAELSQMNRAGGHTRMTSESQYHANMSWAASMLYKATGEQKYADDAAAYIVYALQCQRTEPVGGGLRGFFYRDTTFRSTVHYNHQSRSYAYMEALEALLATQPDYPDRERWMEAVRLYGQYLKDLMAYIEPYGMMPSGVYHKDEVRDSANFYAWQVGIRSGANADYAEMIRNGIQLDEEHYLRKFPVWFSFKGNTACSLSDGKAAAICARLLGDEELKRIAEKQLEWVVGYNPFGQSLIYGEGSNWCQLYNALPGETVGEIPVGMQSYFNEDQPYWPQFNTATYKEVWGGTAVKWLMLIAEF